MSSVATMRDWRRWQRKAGTLLEKSQALLCDMLNEIGPENLETDLADGVVERCEELSHFIDRQCAAKGKLK